MFVEKTSNIHMSLLVSSCSFKRRRIHEFLTHGHNLGFLLSSARTSAKTLPSGQSGRPRRSARKWGSRPKGGCREKTNGGGGGVPRKPVCHCKFMSGESSFKSRNDRVYRETRNGTSKVMEVKPKFESLTDGAPSGET